MRPLVSTTIKEALQEAGGACATCPRTSRPSRTTISEPLFMREALADEYRRVYHASWPTRASTLVRSSGF